MEDIVLNSIVRDANVFVKDRAKVYLKTVLKDERAFSMNSPYGHLEEIHQQVINAINAEFKSILELAKNQGVLEFGEYERPKTKHNESGVAALFPNS